MLFALECASGEPSPVSESRESPRLVGLEFPQFDWEQVRPDGQPDGQDGSDEKLDESASSDAGHPCAVGRIVHESQPTWPICRAGRRRPLGALLAPVRCRCIPAPARCTTPARPRLPRATPPARSAPPRQGSWMPMWTSSRNQGQSGHAGQRQPIPLGGRHVRPPRRVQPRIDRGPAARLAKYSIRKQGGGAGIPRVENGSGVQDRGGRPPRVHRDRKRQRLLHRGVHAGFADLALSFPMPDQT